MEALNVLEQKIRALIEKHQHHCETIKELKNEVAQAKEDKQKLEHKLEQVESQLLSQSQNSQQLDEEQQKTKDLVDELINNIDAVIKEDSHNG